jgi:uncharacterized protein YndB with AHSA1/START domain
METIEVAAEFKVDPKRLYEAWLDGKQHSALTGGAVASVENWVGGQHTAWDGYIWGRILELEPYRRIVQSWRTSEFPVGSQDSRLEVILEPTADGTRLMLRHSNIPDGQGEMYREGWDASYFTPMRAYFKPAEATVTTTTRTEAAPKKTTRKKTGRKVAAPKKTSRKVPARKKTSRKVPARKKTSRKVAARRRTVPKRGKRK